LEKLAYIAIGGGAGAVLRYLLSGWGQRLTAPSTFPFGTLLVNLLGCLAIGAAVAYFAGPHRVREELRLALLIGVLGGFTTFSSYAFETFSLLEDGQRLHAATNLVLSNVLGLFAVWAGYRLIQNLRGA
jgi:CrcB protein